MKPKRPPLRHPQIHLPPLSADYALTLVDVLQRAIAAIWRAHGERMAELLELRTASRPQDPEHADDANTDAHDDIPF